MQLLLIQLLVPLKVGEVLLDKSSHLYVFRGILYVGDKSYGIEPLDGSATFEHMFYQLEHAQQTPFLCGVPNDSLHHEIHVKNFLLHSEVSHANFSSEKLLRVRFCVSLLDLNIFNNIPWGCLDGQKSHFS